MSDDIIIKSMKNNKYGKIIHTSSSSGIYGNFGQSNYAAAKLGLVGLTQTVAIEGRKHNVHCNAIAPVAASRMTEALFPADMLDRLKPDYVAPLTLYLCHDSCEETGATIEVGGGWAAKIRRESAAGAIYATKGSYPTVEDVAANFEKICDFSEDSEAIESITEATMRIMTALMDMPDALEPEVIEDEGKWDSRKIRFIFKIGRYIVLSYLIFSFSSIFFFAWLVLVTIWLLLYVVLYICIEYPYYEPESGLESSLEMPVENITNSSIDYYQGT